MYTGQIIKLIRIADGLRQSDLAERLHVSHTYISLLENGVRQPNIKFLKQFSRQFSVPLPLLIIDKNEEFFTELKEVLIKLLVSRLFRKK